MPTRVLIVDDNRSLAEDLAEILDGEGCETCVYFDSVLALAEKDRLDFDVAVLDVRMPAVDGVALFGELVRCRPSATFVLMSAYASDGQVERAIDAGAKGVLPKPIPLNTLLGIVRAAGARTGTAP